MAPFVVAGVVGLFVLFYAFGLRYVLTYSLTERGLEARYFGISGFTLPYREMDRAYVVSFSESMKVDSPKRLGNRLSGPVVVVARNSGIGKNVLLTPEDPAGFAAEIERRIATERGSGR